MFSVVALGSAILTAFAAPKMAAGVAMFCAFLDGWKAKKKMQAYEAGSRVKLDPAKVNNLKDVTIPEDVFPDEYKFAAGRYFLEERELFTLLKVMEAVIDGNHPEIAGVTVLPSLEDLVREYKELTKVRLEDPAMAEFVS